jgi:hypothetical protein
LADEAEPIGELAQTTGFETIEPIKAQVARRFKLAH